MDGTDRELRIELGRLLPNVSLDRRMRTPNFPRNRNATYLAMQSLTPGQRQKLVTATPARTEAESLLLVLSEEHDYED